MCLIKAARPFNLFILYKKKKPTRTHKLPIRNGRGAAGYRKGDEAAISVPICITQYCIGTLLPHLKCEITSVLAGLTLIVQF